MGLGKTPIAIAIAEELYLQEQISTVLIVCPSSLKYQWAEKILQFTDLPPQKMKLRSEYIEIPARDCVVIDGPPEKRRELYSQKSRYFIISYDIVIRDAQYLNRISPDLTVLDEATAIKTFKAQRTKQVKKLLKSPYRLALTGTPIENRPDELFSIMQWVDPTVLGRFDLFDKAYVKRNPYGWVVGYKNLPVLHKKLSPSFSRKTRRDKDVAPFLPDVDEANWYVEPPSEVMNLYKTIAADMVEEIDKEGIPSYLDLEDYYSGTDESTPSGKLMSMHMCMEMLLDHPDLLIQSAQLFEDTDGKYGSGYAYYLWQAGLIDEVYDTSKLPFLKDRLGDILSYPGNKVLVYSWSRNMIHILDEQLDYLNHTIFHGEMSPAQKAESVARYRNDPLCRVFLSSHAGAYGMDMSMANYLVNYDLPWSSGRADQINGRHVRASSEFGQVYIRNLITTGTVEERKMSILSGKRAVGSAILDNVNADKRGRITLATETLKDHLTSVLQAGRIDR